MIDGGTQRHLVQWGGAWGSCVFIEEEMAECRLEGWVLEGDAQHGAFWEKQEARWLQLREQGQETACEEAGGVGRGHDSRGLLLLGGSGLVPVAMGSHGKA